MVIFLIFIFFFRFFISRSLLSVISRVFSVYGLNIGYYTLFRFFSLVGISLFILLILLKFFGLFPYIFSFTSHFFYLIIISFLIWFFCFSSSILFLPLSFMSSFTPSGSPLFLVFLLNWIELVSLIIRPLTLSLRLSINITTGHIFIILLRSLLLYLFFSLSFFSFLIFLFILIFYFFFEFFVCFIQSFVYCLLINQYLDEHV